MPCPRCRSPPSPRCSCVCFATPNTTGPSSPASTSASTAASPTSPATWPTTPACRYADCATAAQPTAGASRSTSPAKTATKTQRYLRASPPEPPKKPSTAPAPSTSTTKPQTPPKDLRRKPLRLPSEPFVKLPDDLHRFFVAQAVGFAEIDPRRHWFRFHPYERQQFRRVSPQHICYALQQFR